MISKVKLFVSNNFLIIFILILASFLRLYNLGLNPVGVTHDEVHDLVNAKSLAVTGQSAPGTVAGIFTANGYCDSNCIFGELASYLLIPWMTFFPLDIFFSKIPFILVSLGIVYFSGKLFENLSGKKGVGILVSLLVSINPWAIHFGRSAYENLFAFCFYLIGLYFFTKRKKQKQELILGLFFSFLGSLSYMGAKPIFPFIVAWGVAYNMIKDKFRVVKFNLFILFLGILLFSGYFFILKNTTAGQRLGEINLNSQVADPAKLVNDQRRVALEIPQRDIFINKYTVKVPSLLSKYFGLFNANYLFNEGEGNLDVFIISSHAYMYLLDLPFIALGIIAASSIPVAIVFIFLLIAFLPLPSVLSSVHITYALRAGLMFPLLCGLSGWGIYWLYKNLPRFANLTLGLILFVYLISFIYFWMMYAYRTPFEKSTGWFFYERALVKYLTLSELSQQKVIVVAKAPMDLMYEYAFFSGKYNSVSYINEFNDKLKNKIFEIGQIQITNNCSVIDEEVMQPNTTYIVQQGFKCEEKLTNSIKIADPRDSGQNYSIINDNLCSGIKLDRYPYPRNLSQFSVEKMDKNNFCKTWLTNPAI